MTDTPIPESASSEAISGRIRSPSGERRRATRRRPPSPVPDPATPWHQNIRFKVKTYPVGRLKYFVIWPTHGSRTWNRTRWWPTRRNLLNIKGLYNRKTALAEKKILDRRPIYWLLCLDRSCARAPALSRKPDECAADRWRDLRGLRRDQCVLDADPRHRLDLLAGHLCRGRHRRVSDVLSVDPISACRGTCCMPIGAVVGLVFGVLIAAPALRLDGFYYALLTLGLNELFRVFFTTSKQFGSASGGLYGADSFISQNWAPLTQSVVAYYASLCAAHRQPLSLPLHQRQAARPRPAHGAGKARGLRRGLRRRLQAGAHHHLPHDVGRARLHRRLLCRAISRRRLFDLRFPDRAARPRHGDDRRHRARRGRGARHADRHLPARRSHRIRAVALSHHRRI